MHDARPFVDSTSLLNDPPKLRDQIQRDGYLFLRRLADKDALLELRHALLQICASEGWIERSPDPLQAKWSGAGPFTEGDPEYMSVYRQIINHALFKRFADRPEFTATMEKILEGPVLAHRLRIGRVTFPNNIQQSTAAHQDFQYIRGTARTFTIWTPIGDCPIELGGLAVLRGSHAGGFIEHELFKEKKYAGHGLSDEQLPKDNVEWHCGDFAAGDVLIFHSHTVHKAMPNLTSDRLRLSTDNRYQLAGDQIADISMKSHYGL
jgi:ectoine hydroxylase-related dioxygenase (phytanoyl-CoA dioxygenase family)